MAHPRWPGFDTKTGDPTFDNESRRMNRRLWKHAQDVLRVDGAGRRRRKQIRRVEGGKYITAIAMMMVKLHEDGQ